MLHSHVRLISLDVLHLWALLKYIRTHGLWHEFIMENEILECNSRANNLNIASDDISRFVSWDLMDDKYNWSYDTNPLP